MNRAGRLGSAEHPAEPRIRCGYRRRHSHAGDDHQRQAEEDHCAVGALLHQAVGRSTCRCADLPLQTAGQVMPQPLPRQLAGPGHEIAPQVSGEDPGKEINGPCHDQEPRRKEVQAPGPAILVQDAVGADRADCGATVREGLRGDCPAAVPVVPADRQLDQRGREVVADRAPVEPRVSHEDGEAGDGERQHAGSHDPVSDPDPATVAGACARGVLTGAGPRHGVLRRRPVLSDAPRGGS